MFCSNVKIAEKYDYLAPKFKAAYKWLADANFSTLADGKYRVLGDDVIADVQTYTTQPVELRRFEAHDVHFDIQYIAEGEEFFGVSPRENLKISEAHPERDTFFFESPQKFTMILLREGDFVVVAPEDAHMPKCAVENPARVRKVVIKIKV